MRLIRGGIYWKLSARNTNKPGDAGEEGNVADRYDVVVVGGGPAGAVIASRLSEDPAKRVLLIEAGPDYGANFDDWPSGLLDYSTIQPDSHSWGHFDKERPSGMRLQLPRARVLGGSSTVNGCIWLRGSRSDYDEWAAAGNDGWSWADMEPWFNMVESDSIEDGLHGRTGLVPIWRATDEMLSPIDRAFMESAHENGLPYLADLNATADQQPGAGKTPKNVQDGRRISSGFSYLAPARSRENLTILPDTLVDRVLVEDGKAVGVLTADGETILGGEVVLTAGAYCSPAVLLRSGVGPADHLQELGIPCLVDLPGVGSNLMDHPQLARQSGYTSFAIKRDHTPADRTFIQTMVKARSRFSGGDVDLHLYPAEMFDERFDCWTFAFGVTLQYARSLGTVRLTSTDPEAPLDIDHNHFSHPDDIEAICDGYELMLRIATTPPLSTALEGPCLPGEHLTDRDVLKEIIRQESGTTYHPSTTCKMGPKSDPLAVVDNAGCVYGVEHLRVADASIFPCGPRANLHFTIIAAAEKIAAGMMSP